MTQQDADASKVYEPEEVLGVTFMACDEASVVLEPRKEALDLPAVAIAAKGSAVLGRRAPSTLAMRRDHLDPAFPPQAFVEPVTIVGAIADQPGWRVSEEAVVDCLINEGDLMWRSTCDPGGDRKTSAV